MVIACVMQVREEHAMGHDPGVDINYYICKGVVLCILEMHKISALVRNRFFLWITCTNVEVI